MPCLAGSRWAVPCVPGNAEGAPVARGGGARVNRGVSNGVQASGRRWCEPQATRLRRGFVAVMDACIGAGSARRIACGAVTVCCCACGGRAVPREKRVVEAWLRPPCFAGGEPARAGGLSVGAARVLELRPAWGPYRGWQQIAGLNVCACRPPPFRARIKAVRGRGALQVLVNQTCGARRPVAVGSGGTCRSYVQSGLWAGRKAQYHSIVTV